MNEPIKSRSALKQENANLMSLAAQEAVRRNAAEDVAALEILQRRQAENAAMDARIAANQAEFQAAQLNTEREALHSDLRAERTAASNAAFGLTLAAAIALVGLIAFGVWYASGSSRTVADNTTSAVRTAQSGSDAGRAAIVTTPAPSRPTHSDYHPAASAVKVSAAKSRGVKTAPPSTSHPSRTPGSEPVNSNSSTSDDADTADSDDNSESDSSDSDAASTGNDKTDTDKNPGNNADTSSH